MSGISLPMLLVVVLAVIFGFLNGFRDSASIIATLITSRALSGRRARDIAALAEFAGPFIFGVAVATTWGSHLLAENTIALSIILAALITAIAWNLITWWLGIPSSSSHALVGGLVGAAVMEDGWGTVTAGMLPVFRVPIWVIALSAGSVALGTATGSWRLVKTLGAKFYKIRPVHGFTAQVASASVILGAALLGGPVSTTHIVSTAIMGSGAAERLSQVRWGTVRQITVVWLTTIPFSALFAAGLAAILRRWL